MNEAADIERIAAENAALKQALLAEQKRRKEALLDRQSIIESKDQRIAQLEELIRSLQRKQYGPSSEKNPDQLGLFNEAEEGAAAEPEPTTEVPAHTRKRRGRPALPESLPREEIVYDVAEQDRVCPHDGAVLKPMGFKTSEQLEIIPAQVKVIVHKRAQYACPCCESHVVTANKPAQLLGKSIATAGTLAWVATSKYADALPLYRQCQMLQRAGVELDRTTLAHWMIRCGEAVQPLINRLTEHILEGPIIRMDETPVQVLKEPGKPAQSDSYMWLLSDVDARTVVFRYDPGRGGDVPLDMVSDYRGVLMVDGYGGYNAVCAKNSLIRLSCLAHVRRKFIDAKESAKGRTGKADQALAWIQRLYGIEKQAKDLSADERYALRQRAALPIVNTLEKWLKKSITQVPKGGKLGKAIAYANNHWPNVRHYLADGRYPIDNNLAENAIRPFAVGRKNWLFANSQSGARASANLYSLIQTATRHGLNPHEYLRKVFTALPTATTVEDIDALLPFNIKM